jgi:2-polyprenyl-6-methoxyphenol hydroxylase-like FAD-dependent oxidoreductase
MSDSTAPRVAIVGAGPGGLVCARVMQRHGLPVTVFERETSPTARSQGGTLDIHDDTGQVALRAAGLLDRFWAIARPEGQEMRLLDRNATVVRHLRPADGDTARPEIDRGQLRGLLLDSLTPGSVRWGCRVAAVTPLAGGTVQVRHADATVEEFDLVVGADGAWSRVRPALSDAQPAYSGVTYVESYFDDVDRRHPEIARLVGDGTLSAKAGRRSLVAQRNSDGRIRLYAFFRGPLEWHAGVDLDDTEAVRATLLEMYQGWDERLRDLLRHNDGGFVNRPLFVLPVPHAWERVPGVTLLGDAAHLMPPAGLGANLAMLDGAELARAVVGHPDVEEALSAYESVMLPRSGHHAKVCGEMLATLMPDTDSTEALFPDMAAFGSA